MTLRYTFLQEQQINEETKLYRYMDFASFISLIQNKELVFKRTDMYSDKQEGLLPKQINEFYKTFPDKGENEFSEWLELTKDYNKTIYVNCWSSNENDISLWERFCGKDLEYGIAICSTLSKMNSALSEEITMGEIVYVKTNDTITDINKSFTCRDLNVLPCSQYAALMKRIAFKSEGEYRLMLDTVARDSKTVPISIPISTEIQHIKAKVKENENILVRPVKVTLEQLIEKVIISPYGYKNEWYHNLVKALLAEKGPNVQVEISNLLGDPS